MKSFFSKVFLNVKKLYNNETPLKIEWICGIIIALVMLSMFAYIDLKSLTIWSTNILDCIIDGNLADYFKFTALNLHNAPHTYVSGTLYSLVPWAIWNIPIWILQRFFKIEILTNPISLIWSHLFLVLALIVTLYYAYKIVVYLTEDKVRAHWAIFLSFTYIFTYIGVFYSGQNDILICMLGTIAIYNLIKNNNKMFYLLASFAISVKYFFFLPFILIVLLLEKNILKICRNILIGLTPTILFNLVCLKLPMFLTSSANNMTSSILRNLTAGAFPILANQSVSLFIMAYIVLAFIAYVTKPKDEVERNNFILYFIVASIILLVTVSSNEFYRSILLMPFMFILFAINKKTFRLNIIIETIGSFFYLISTSITSSYIFSSVNSMTNTLLSNFIAYDGIKRFGSKIFFKAYLGKSLSMFTSITATIAFTALMLILFINYPRNKFKIEDNMKLERYIVWARMLCVVPFLIYLLLCVMYH